MSTHNTTYVLSLIDRITAPLDKVGRVAGGASSRLDGVVDSANRLNKASIGDALGGMLPGLPGGASIASLANPAAAATVAVAGVGAVLASATQEAAAFDAGMHKVNATLQLTPDALKALGDDVLDTARGLPVDMAKVPDALNRIVSAGITDQRAAMDALLPTLKAAKAGYTDVETAAAAAVSVMQASGNGDIARTYDILAAAQREGNAEFAQMAQYLPKIVPSAEAAGFGLEQVAGAFAFLTAQGQQAEESTTLLQNTMKALTMPERIKALQGIGVAIYDQGGNRRSLVDIVGDLDKRLTGLNAKQKDTIMGKLGLDDEARRGLLALTGDVDKLRKITDATVNSQGALDKAYKASLSTADRWKIVQNDVQYLMIKLGEKILPYVESALEKVQLAFDWFFSGSEVVKQFGDDISTIFGDMWKSVTMIFGGESQLDWDGILPGDAFMQKLSGSTNQIAEIFRAMAEPTAEYMKMLAGRWDEVDWAKLNNMDNWRDVLSGDAYKQGVEAERLRQQMRVLQQMQEGTWMADKSPKADVPKGKGDNTSLASNPMGLDFGEAPKGGRIVSINIGTIQAIVQVKETVQGGLDELAQAVARQIVDAQRDAAIIISNQ